MMNKKRLKSHMNWLHTRGWIPESKGLLVVLTCGGYLVVSSQLIVLNKYLLQHDKFHYPLFLSNMGMLFTFLASSFCSLAGIIPRQQAIRTREYISRFVPLGFWTAASIGLGNIGSLYLDMGLVEMLKGFCPVVVQFVAFSLGLEKFSWLPVLATSLIATVALFEWSSFVENRAWEIMLAHPHWYLAAASLGFCVNVLAYCVIKLAGSITQKVLGTIKNVMLVVLSVFVMGEQVSARQWLGYQCSILGFVWYQYLKLCPRGRVASAQGSKKSR